VIDKRGGVLSDATRVFIFPSSNISLNPWAFGYATIAKTYCSFSLNPWAFGCATREKVDCHANMICHIGSYNKNLDPNLLCGKTKICNNADLSTSSHMLWLIFS
jgi:hypothetical protein